VNTTITATVFAILFIIYIVLTYVLFLFGFELKNVLAIDTPIFVALIALISNQWGLYLNKQYDVKFYVNKKSIEDLEKLIIDLENIHEKCYKLIDEYNKLRFDPKIMEAFFSIELYPQVKAKKSSEANQITREMSLIYFSNYLILSEETKNIYSDIISANLQNSLDNFWEEIYSRQVILDKNIILDEIMPKHFNNIGKITEDFLVSILRTVAALKQQKSNLLKQLLGF